eukprot:1154081-Pelagomonas_calceolata.AAC.4
MDQFHSSFRYSWAIKPRYALPCPPGQVGCQKLIALPVLPQTNSLHPTYHAPHAVHTSMQAYKKG